MWKMYLLLTTYYLLLISSRCSAEEVEDVEDAESAVAQPQDPRQLDHSERRQLERNDCTGSFSNPSDTYDAHTGELYQITAVVHVITMGSGTEATGYISPECVRSGIEMLNRDFRAQVERPGRGWEWGWDGTN